MKFITLKVGGATWGHFQRFPHLHEASNMCTHFFSKSIRSSWAQPSPCPKEGKKKPTKIGHHFFKRYWLLNLPPTFGQHMEPPLKTSNANLTKRITCLEYEVFICYFGPHGSGHHPPPGDTFHPRRLPPSGLQTHKNIRWRPISGCMSI